MQDIGKNLPYLLPVFDAFLGAIDPCVEGVSGSTSLPVLTRALQPIAQQTVRVRVRLPCVKVVPFQLLHEDNGGDPPAPLLSAPEPHTLPPRIEKALQTRDAEVSLDQCGGTNSHEPTPQPKMRPALHRARELLLQRDVLPQAAE